jgi:hypothetical protein
MNYYNEMNTEGGKDWKWTSPMYIKYRRKHNLSTKQIDDMLNKISWVESKQANIQQYDNGPGQGFYQIEWSKGKGSGTFKTLLQQYQNVTGTKPQWVVDALKNDDPKLLTKEQQSELALAGIYQSSGSDDRLLRYSSGDVDALEDIWIKDWWKGSLKDEKSKRKQWKNEMNDFKYQKTTNPDSVTLVMDDMVSSDNPLKL